MIKQVAQMLQFIPSMIELIKLSWIMKSMHVELLPYLSLKAPLEMTISVYYMIYQSNTYTDTWSQS